jgi:hypothetical protein
MVGRGNSLIIGMEEIMMVYGMERKLLVKW